MHIIELEQNFQVPFEIKISLKYSITRPNVDRNNGRIKIGMVAESIRIDSVIAEFVPESL